MIVTFFSVPEPGIPPDRKQKKNLSTLGSHSAVNKQPSSSENTAEMRQLSETKRFQSRYWPRQTSELSPKPSCHFSTFFLLHLVAADHLLHR